MTPTGLFRVAAAACCLPVASLAIFGLRLNFSPSLPIGIYVVTNDSSASLVEFCPAEPYASLALQRGYRSAGNCPDGGTPLMKPIVARAGDVVKVSDRGVAVNGTLLQNTAPKPTDTKGRPMAPYPFGEYTVAPGFAWVASSFNSRSFDSRYLGPISTDLIRHHLKPFLTE